MKTFLYLVFIICLNGTAGAQNFRYFVLDTVSPRIVYMKLKGHTMYSKPMDNVDWNWQKQLGLINQVENRAFREAFRNVDWKQIPALADVGVFFQFDKTFHIDYIHFAVPRRLFSDKDLLRLEKNFYQYTRLVKEIDLRPYLDVSDPEKFVNGISRFVLIRKTSDVWNEK